MEFVHQNVSEEKYVLLLLKLMRLEKNKKYRPEVIAGMFFYAFLIFYENRSGKLVKQEEYLIFGGGTHNPYSNEQKKYLMGIFRFDVTVSHKNWQLYISWERVNQGLLKGTFTYYGTTWTIQAQTKLNKKNDSISFVNIVIKVTHHKTLVSHLTTALVPITHVLMDIHLELVKKRLADRKAVAV